MTDWTEGYVADIAYTHGYYGELNPLHHRAVFLNQGLIPAEIYTACELGFGQGISVNIHSAASQVEWWGTDFNPNHAAFAQDLAQVAESKAKLFDQSFAEFCSRKDLPDFDYISMHGIWSWISDENRSVIVDFVKRKLKVGGVFYISYNTQPGWASMVPLRALMAEYFQVMGSPAQGALSRVDAALDFTEQLFAVNPGYLRANPGLSERFKNIKNQNRQYLAHEYFNQSWQPMLISDIAKWLSPAKLDYAGSAHYLDHFEAFNFTEAQQKFLQDIHDPIFKELIRDYIVNQQFRRDYWTKGRRKVSPIEQADLIKKLRVILITPRSEISLKLNTLVGTLEMRDSIYNPLLNILADYKPKTIAQIQELLKNTSITFFQLWQAVLVLMHNGNLSVTYDDAQIEKAKLHTDKLNLHILYKASGNNELNYLASPVTGGAISIGRFNQLFLLAKQQGKKTPQEWADFVWSILLSQGQRIVKEGKQLTTAEENIADLRDKAILFADQQMPILRELKINT